MARRDVDQHFFQAITVTTVAALGLLALLFVNHGPWSKPKVQTETTAASAAAVGATVSPTEQKRELEPAVHGPKLVPPAISDQKKS
jgi:hypothetical protein